jgi:hypothetical protein
MEKSQQFIIRHDNGSTMWLTRESPLAWGERERAIRYASKGDAMRAVDRINVHSTITVEPLARSLDDESGHWRTRAEEARLKADKLKNPESRRMMLEIAANYDRLAELARQRDKT